MNSIRPNHKFTFSNKNLNLVIINGQVFLEDSAGTPQDIRMLNPCRRRVSLHVINALTKSINPQVVLSVLRKKTCSLKWELVEAS